MASTIYGGIEFHTLAEEKEGTLSRPMLVPTEFGVVRTKLPYANQEQIQLTGRGNRRLELKCEIDDEGDFTTLLLMTANGQAHTLVCEWGDLISNVYLLEMKDVWRVTFGDTEIHFTGVFEVIG